MGRHYEKTKTILDDIIIGNSGFKYIEIYQNIYGIEERTCEIKYVKTGKILFSLTGKEGKYQGRGTRATKSKDTIGAKRFLGLDNRYYYIEVTYHKTMWGQIQSSGAVIAQDRTIIKQLDFFPMNIETPTVPILETIPIKSTILDIPPIKTLTPVISDKKEIKWIEQIMNQINQIMNQINQAIQSILNQLKLNK